MADSNTVSDLPASSHIVGSPEGAERADDAASWTVYRYEWPDRTWYIGVTSKTPQERGFGSQAYNDAVNIRRQLWPGAQPVILESGLSREVAETVEGALIRIGCLDDAGGCLNRVHNLSKISDQPTRPRRRPMQHTTRSQHRPSTMTSRLCVILSGAYAADIEHRARRPTLTYRPDYIASAAVPLSARFPLSRRQTTGVEVRRWLLNLLSDDDNVLSHLLTECGAAARDPLRLLETPMGADCAGAVQFCPPEHLDTLMSADGAALPISDAEIADWLDGYPVVPAAVTGEGATLPVTFSLAGMQPKIALRLTDDGTWARTWGRTPTTHIIKAARADFPDECVFEHLTMSTARRLGVPTASTAAADIGGVQALIVTRFDRASRGQVRIHQEDSCQALGLAPTDKYENHGGPGAADLRRLAQTGGPATQRNVARLRDMLLYRWLVVDSDAHAKNYSWMFDEAGDMHLAPLYDSSSWLPFRRGMAIQDIPLAMRMGNGSRVSECDTPDGLTGLADSLRLPRQAVCERAAELAEALPTALKAAADELPATGFDWGRVEEHIAEIDVRASLCERVAEQTLQKTTARRERPSVEADDEKPPDELASAVL